MREYMAMPRSGVVGMGVGNDRTIDRNDWIDEEAARLAE